LSLVLKKSVVLAAHAVMTAVRVQALHLVAPVVRSAAMPLPLMAATSPLKHSVLTLKPPLSAFAKSPRQLQQLTVKENNHVATRSPEIPQRAKGP
jgi:hypothetical protein